MVRVSMHWQALAGVEEFDQEFGVGTVGCYVGWSEPGFWVGGYGVAEEDAGGETGEAECGVAADGCGGGDPVFGDAG